MACFIPIVHHCNLRHWFVSVFVSVLSLIYLLLQVVTGAVRVQFYVKLWMQRAVHEGGRGGEGAVVRADACHFRVIDEFHITCVLRLTVE
jgi:hypothetical protein